MAEVKVLSDDLNGLGWTVKSLVDQNLEQPEMAAAAAKIRGALAITESEAQVAVTLVFDGDGVSIENGARQKRSASLSGSFDQLSELISGQIGPIKALLTGKIKAGGNLLKLLKMAKVIITKE